MDKGKTTPAAAELTTSSVGGRLALDFANSGSPRRPLSWEEVILFLEAAKVISAERSAVLLELPETDAAGAHTLLKQATLLRASLRQIFAGLVRRVAAGPEAVEAINDVLQITEGHDELRQQAGGWRIEFVAREAGLAWLLAAVARSAAEIVAEGLEARVRLCANPECGLFFYDDSRTKRRRWCSMALCGNRHKAAAFAKKHAKGAKRG